MPAQDKATGDLSHRFPTTSRSLIVTAGHHASGSARESAGASFLSSSYDTALTNGIPGLAAADSVNISVLNTYALLDTIVADPSAYGFSNVTQPCLTGEINYAGGTPCANPSQYLFWDQLHPTAGGHEIVADEALALVTPEPTSLSLIAAGLIGLAIWRQRSAGERQ